MNLTLRQFNINDVDSLTKYANNYNVSRFLCHIPFPYTTNDAINFIERVSKNGSNDCVFCIEVNNEAIGGIGLHVQQGVYCKNAEIGYWIGEPFWNKGIVTQAITQIIDYGFKNLDINRIYGRTFEDNIASEKSLLKTGFVMEAQLEKTFYKNGVYYNEKIWGIRKQQQAN